MYLSQVLLTLPEASRQDYFSLLSDLLLMLEQLLMNLKVDWASVAVSTLRNLLPAQDAGITNQHIDTILADYARKALDFPYAPREWSRSGEFSPAGPLSPRSRSVKNVVIPNSHNFLNQKFCRPEEDESCLIELNSIGYFESSDRNASVSQIYYIHTSEFFSNVFPKKL